VRILGFADWYLPGHKGGGSVSALSSLIGLVGEEFDFYVFTRDHDLNDCRPYATVPLNQWVTHGKAQVLYTGNLSFRHLWRRVREIQPDIIYLNSFFSRLTIRILLLRRIGLLAAVPIVLAPRGELAPAALRVKPLQKWLYLRAARWSGLCRNLRWQASSECEQEQILQAFGRSARAVQIAGDVPGPRLLAEVRKMPDRRKLPGVAHFVFFSRVSRNKNLDFALSMLASVSGFAELDICGPIGDVAYWKECERKIRALPGHVTVRYAGVTPREEITPTLAQYDFLLLPTGGENFGYVILEALAAGCPVVISNQTPWQDLEERGVGWTVSLQDRARWREVLQACTEMDEERHVAVRQRAREYATAWASSSAFREQHLRLFQQALACAPSRRRRQPCSIPGA